MDYDKYRLLIRAADLGNLSRAAEALGYTQSNASYTISSLESELGVRILRRDRSGTHLTSEGRYLLPALRELVSSEEKIHTIANSLNHLEIGTLKIGAFTSICLTLLPKIISKFRRKYPGIQIEIITNDGSYSEMEKLLQAGVTDCSFVLEPAAGGLQCVHLFDDPLKIIMPVSWKIAETGEDISLRLLQDRPFLMPSEGNNTDILRICRQYGFHPHAEFTMKDDPAILAMSENGLGWSIMPQLLLSDCRYHLQIRNIEGRPSRSIGIAVRSGESLSPLIQGFIQSLQSLMPE